MKDSYFLQSTISRWVSYISFFTVKCCSLKKGDYPENLHVVFCQNKVFFLTFYLFGSCFGTLALSSSHSWFSICFFPLLWKCLLKLCHWHVMLLAHHSLADICCLTVKLEPAGNRHQVMAFSDSCTVAC